MPVTVWQVRARVPPAAGSDLSPAVFCQLLRLLCVPAATISSPVQQVDDIFKLYDGASGSKDGVIDYDEFQKVLREPFSTHEEAIGWGRGNRKTTASDVLQIAANFVREGVVLQRWCLCWLFPEPCSMALETASTGGARLWKQPAQAVNLGCPLPRPPTPPRQWTTKVDSTSKR